MVPDTTQTVTRGTRRSTPRPANLTVADVPDRAVHGTRVVGSPARHATRLFWRAFPVIVAGYFVVGVAGLALFVSSAVPFDNLQRVAVGAFAGIAVGVPVYFAEIRARKARAGVLAERRTADVLNRAGFRLVAHGAVLPGGGDVDHVVVGSGACVVETKHGRGPVQALRDGRVVVNGRLLRGRPLQQAARQAAAVRSMTGQWTGAVVCIVDGQVVPTEVRGVWVCSLRDLPSTVARAEGKTLSDRQVDELVARLRWD
jgi:hypothetical protein